jgi:DNA-binding PadR family transcriptional regulator
MPQDRLTTFEYALLGLIGMSPMAGYDVHRVFATTPLAHFSSSPGAIYPALRRLARRDLLEARLDTSTEARPRRVYALTEGGEAALEAWLRQPVTREELIRGQGAPILRFALAEGRLSKDEVLAYLQTYQGVLAAYLDELGIHAEEMEGTDRLHARLALDHGIRGYQSELEWVKSAAACIKRAPRGARRRRASR